MNQTLGCELADSESDDKGAELIGYKGRTVRDKLDEVISVKDYGAKGDGITDDTTAIQAALNIGKAVFFPEGDYRVTAGLALPDGHVCITGAGPRKSRLLVNHTSTVISYTSTHRRRQAVFKDFSFVAVNAGSTLALNVVFPVTTGLDQIQLIVENVSVSIESGGVWAQGGIRCENVTNSIFSKFVMTGTYATTQYGISLEGQCLNSTISQSRSTFCKMA
ncbi:pectate lyase-like protein [Pseudomonas duriflava]|uniref:Pectate lyase-like protein n=1 Tax=Pseudomonas duriflava TaxID=459528 RepID=A0A562PNU4_9PSED|nr:glycosyl hydrolase family 28-related protein [Pseudomonas duriflava]TWI45746.1 pectate lyase-like protein [Pseudomonas duriflava]